MKELIKTKLDEARSQYEKQVESNGYVGDELYLQGRYDAFFELWEAVANDQDD